MYSDCAHIISKLVGTEYLYFDSPITIKLSPHTHPVNIWAASVSPLGVIYLMDNEQIWWELDENNSGTVLQSLYQRLKLIEKTLKTAER